MLGREVSASASPPMEPEKVDLNEPLQKWYVQWLKGHEATTLIYAGASRNGGKADPQLHQVHFIRDIIAPMFWKDMEYEAVPVTEWFDQDYYGGGVRREKDIVRVIGEHYSKSVRLPVYRISRPDIGFEVVMRYNFYDWNVSVNSQFFCEMNMSGYGAQFSEEDIKRHPNGYEKGRYWGYLYFQGFPAEYWYGPYGESSKQFSFSPGSDYELYAWAREFAYKFVRKVSV